GFPQASRPRPRSGSRRPRSARAPRSATPCENKAMAQAAAPRTQAARELFAPLGPTYDRYARLLSLGQDPRWRRFLVERIDVGANERGLDGAPATGARAPGVVA